MEASKKDIIVAILVGLVFIFLFCSLMIMVLINFVRRKRKILLEKQEREAAFQQQLLQVQIEMQENTLKTISQEIHDNVGQVLSLAKMNLSILTLKDKSNEKLEDIKELVGKAIVDLRALSTGYYGQGLEDDTGLIKAITREIKRLEKTELFSIHFTTEIAEIELEKNKAIFLCSRLLVIMLSHLRDPASHVQPASTFFCNLRFCSALHLTMFCSKR